MTLPRVYLVKGDETGWAIDEDRRLTRAGLEGVVEFVDDPAKADVIHSCWWEPLMQLPAAACRGKRVLCHLEEDVALRLSEPSFLGAVQRVTHWVGQSLPAVDEMSRVAGTARVFYMPYAVDVECFAKPSETPGDAVRGAMAARAELPADSYLIANFHRDTLGASYGGTPEPKLKKGPDLFLEILSVLHDKRLPVVALLAGPRRHWVREHLRKRGIPFIFAGAITEGDDYPRNILPLTQVAHLYKMAHLHLNCSRHEGGPRGVLEAAAAGIGQISTPCGTVPDLLPAHCLFADAARAVDLILEDMAIGSVRRFAPAAAAMVRGNHTADANHARWGLLYDRLIADPVPRQAARTVFSKKGAARRVSFWHEFQPPPWGGGNQFMVALKKECERRGVEVTVNGEGPPATAHLLNSCWLDVEKFKRVMEEQASLMPRVVHRIDGPINLYRRTPDSMELDRLCFALNAEYASATVLQSRFVMRALAQGGYAAVRPVIVHNAVDAAIFHRGGAAGEDVRRRAELRAGRRPLKLVASSWSDNPGKGAAIFEWLDRNLDPSRVEFTFVGRCKTPLRNARVIEAQASEPLAEYLREADVYLAASRDDPCSNALVEALACGLPAVYFDSGGHGELVQFGGMPFTSPRQVPGLLERVREHYDAFRNVISPPTMEDVGRRYLELMLGDRAYAE